MAARTLSPRAAQAGCIQIIAGPSTIGPYGARVVSSEKEVYAERSSQQLGSRLASPISLCAAIDSKQARKKEHLH